MTMTATLCPTCNGSCCTDKYGAGYAHVPFVPYAGGRSHLYWTHSCPDCEEGLSWTAKPAETAAAIERGEHRD